MTDVRFEETSSSERSLQFHTRAVQLLEKKDDVPQRSDRKTTFAKKTQTVWIINIQAWYLNENNC